MSAVIFIFAALSGMCAVTAWNRERGVALFHVFFSLFLFALGVSMMVTP